MKERVYENHQKRQRQVILDVAEELFITYGIEKVTTSMIAKECGLSRPTIYHYFPKKEDIYLGLLRDYTALAYKQIVSNCSSTSTTYERFETFAHTLTTFILENEKASSMQLIVAQMFPVNELEKTDEHQNPIVAFLMENFHDGSVKETLDPMPTTLAFLYGIQSTTLTFFRLKNNIQTRYECDIHSLVQTYIKAQLEYIKKG